MTFAGARSSPFCSIIRRSAEVVWKIDSSAGSSPLSMSFSSRWMRKAEFAVARYSMARKCLLPSLETPKATIFISLTGAVNVNYLYVEFAKSSIFERFVQDALNRLYLMLLNLHAESLT